MNDAPVAVGEVIADKYRVDRVLGIGGMGVVVEATHLVLEQKVAIKFLLAELAQHPEAGARFQREARAAAKIQSVHVCRVLDVGQTKDGAPFMVMEYLEGCDLGQELDSGGPIDSMLAVDYVLQACEALAEAHAAGIVHRDLKPPNLFLAERTDGSRIIKVLDFGISKLTDGDVHLTKTSSVMGSPQYMAPEQMQSSKQVDPRTDIWALGAILYELLAGTPAFAGETVPEICINIVNTEPRPLEEIREDVPQELIEIIATCLRKNPDERFENVADLGNALSQFGPPMSHLSVERVSRVLHTVTYGTPHRVTQDPLRTRRPSQQEVSPTVASYAELPTQQRKSRLPLVLGGVACLLLGVVVAVGVVSVNRGDPASAAGSPSGEVLPAATQSSTGSPAADATPSAQAPSPAPSEAAPAPSASVSAPEAVAEVPAATAKPSDTGVKTRPQPTAKPTSQPASGSGTDLSGFGDRK